MKYFEQNILNFSGKIHLAQLFKIYKGQILTMLCQYFFYSLPMIKFFNSILRLCQHPCSAHAGYIGTGWSLLVGHNALLLRHIARDPAVVCHSHATCSWYHVSNNIVGHSCDVTSCWRYKQRLFAHKNHWCIINQNCQHVYFWKKNIYHFWNLKT